MSKKYTFYQIWILFVCFILTSCTSSVYVNILQPATITMPLDVQTIVVVNRYRPEKGQKLGNVLEGVLTGEKLWEDRDGAERSVAGLIDALNYSPRFTVAYPKLELKGTGTGSFPPPLSWDEVADICQNHKADVLVTLDAFDSDARYGHQVKNIVKKGQDGKQYEVPVHQTTYDMGVTVGWRVYLLSHRRIIDEHRMTQRNTWSGDGPDEKQAKAKLPYSRDAVMNVGYSAGKAYATRISPTWIRESRSYYTKAKKNPDMKRARNMVQTNNWEGAAKIWKPLAEDQSYEHPKVKGRAAFNMALASEVQGHLKAAVDWAQKSYKDYGNKQALSYLNVLKQRLYNEEVLEKQMGEE